MKHIAILGRQHHLALAELESLYGASKLSPINSSACFVDTKVDFARIGSSVKFGTFISTSSTTSIEHVLADALPYIVQMRAEKEGKLQLGVSVYGDKVSPDKINRAALGLKKKLRNQKLSVRLIPNKHQDLNAAQVLRNKLVKENGIELCLIQDRGKTHIAQTTDVQDIDEYTRRDRDKPVRDPLVGMLPPKLAQTLINLTNAQKDSVLLDPFCGTGTVLMEAFEMGINSHGSDISPEMIDASSVNMTWFTKGKSAPHYEVELADACSHQWGKPITEVAGETYLGPALRNFPEDEALDRIIEEVDDIHRRFLQNLAPQLESGTRLALAVPAWYKDQRFMQLKAIDDLEELGYTHSSFIHASEVLVYHRPQQLVGRRILTLIRK